MRWPSLLTVATVATVACGGGADPEFFLIYDLDDSGAYHLLPTAINTLTDPEHGRGTIAQLRGGGDLVVSLKEPITQNDWINALTLDGDHTPDIRFDVTDGVAIPWDFDSAMMLTLYHHLEKAAGTFENAGADELRRMPVHYYVELTIPFVFLTGPLLTDNAAYLVTLDAFIVPPQDALDAVPLFANRGVITHEYSHAVLNRILYDDSRVLPYLLDDWPTTTVNELRSLDEGVADLFGAIETGDPAYIEASILEEHGFDVTDRDLSVERFYDAAMRARVTTEDLIDFDPYRLGSVVASALWALREDVDDETLTSAIVAALRKIGPADTTFEVVHFFDALVEELPADFRNDACTLFKDRLSAVAGAMECSP